MNKEFSYSSSEWCINLCVAACVLLLVFLYVMGGKMMFIIVVMVILFIVICVVFIVNEEFYFNEFTSFLFGLIYCGFLSMFWVKFCGMSGVLLVILDSLFYYWFVWFGGLGIWIFGFVVMIIIVFFVVSADVGVYAFGKNFGKNKFMVVSLNKMVEGVIGGLLVCVGMCVVLFLVMGWFGIVW